MFDDLGLERVELTTTPDNAPVAALDAKLGFGLLRDEWAAALSRAAAAS